MILNLGHNMHWEGAAEVFGPLCPQVPATKKFKCKRDFNRTLTDLAAFPDGCSCMGAVSCGGLENPRTETIAA